MSFLNQLRFYPLGFISFIIIVISFFLAVFGYAIVSDNSKDANTMHLPIRFNSPGFSTEVLVIPSKKTNDQSFLNRFFFGNKYPNQEIVIKDYTISKDNIKYKEIGNTQWKIASVPNAFVETKTFILGTDKYGRDMFSRIVLGLRISLSVGIVAVFVSLFIGVFLGAIGGYYGGVIDKIVIWFFNINWSIPTLLLVIAISLVLGKGYWQVFFAIGLTMWVEVGRVVRGQILSIKQRQFVTASHALGYSNFRIITKHILPHTVASLIVVSSANFATAILLESGLSFLGIGLQPPTPGWGSIIKDHYNHIVLGKAYLAIIPGMAIMILVMSFMLFANAIQEINKKNYNL